MGRASDKLKLKILTSVAGYVIGDGFRYQRIAQVRSRCNLVYPLSFLWFDDLHIHSGIEW